MKALLESQVFRLGIVLVIGLIAGGMLAGGGAEHHEHGAPADGATEWTCSMHPQVRQGEPGQCPICGMDLVPVGGTDGPRRDNPYVTSMTPEAAALAGVETTVVTASVPEEERHLIGRVVVDERRVSAITATVPGRIERLYVDFTGQSVKKGQTLASIYSPDLIVAQTELIEAASTRSESPELYRAAREKLRLWRITDAQMDEIEKRGQVRTEIDVRADVSGIVTNRRVAVGDYVNRGSVLFDVADLSRVWVLLDAYESDLPRIAVGSKVRFEVASLPGRAFESEVTFVDPVLDPRKRTASVRAEADNPDLLLKPDVFVRARVLSRDDSIPRLLIPRTAVLWTGKRSVVYVRSSGDAPGFEMREVTLGTRAGADYVAESGLSEGEEVVSRGVFAVDAAAQLNGGFSMMTRPSRTAAPDAFRQQVAGIASSYFTLKNALVAGDTEAARLHARAASDSVQAVDGHVLEGSGHDAWAEMASRLTEVLSRLAGEEDLEGARKVFIAVSKVMIEVVDTFAPPLESAYVQFCPMAADFAGAHWLSEVESIRNPYFGDRMLECGDTVRPVTHSATPRTASPGHRH